MQNVFSLLLRLLLLVAAIVFALSLLFAAAVLLLAWIVRASWARLTGRPVTAAFVMRVDPRSGFDQVFGAQRRRAGPGAPPMPGRGDRSSDVVDVEARPARD